MTKVNKKTKDVEFIIDTPSGLSEKQIANHVRDVKLLTNKQKVSLNSTSVVSHRIRYLLSESYTRSQVSNILFKRYQHVRNVEITPIKKSTK